MSEPHLPTFGAGSSFQRPGCPSGPRVALARLRLRRRRYDEAATPDAGTELATTPRCRSAAG